MYTYVYIYIYIVIRMRKPAMGCALHRRGTTKTSHLDGKHVVRRTQGTLGMGNGRATRKLLSFSRHPKMLLKQPANNRWFFIYL